MPWWWCERTSERSPTIARVRVPATVDDLVLPERRVVEPVGRLVDHVVEVLHERPAAGDVQELDPAADREHGQVALERPAQEPQLGRVAAHLLGRGARVGVVAVQVGADVLAARHDQPVEQVEGVAGSCSHSGSGGSTSARPPASRTPST